MKKFLFCVLIILISTNISFGYTLIESSFYGNPQRNLTARSLGMGGCKLATEKSAASLFFNPATISLSTRMLVNGNISTTRSMEKITRKVFDEFDNTIGDATYASNSNFYTQPTYLGIVLPLQRFGLLNNTNISFAYTRYFDFTYDYDELFYDNEYEKDYSIDYSIEGGLNNYAAGFSFNPHQAISIGASMQVVNGKKETDRKYIKYNDPEESTEFHTALKDLGGMQYGFGILFQPLQFKKRLTIGFMGKTAFDLEGDYSAEDESYTRTITYPSQFGFGFSYIPQNEIPSQLTFDFIYTKWSDLKDKVDDVVVEDIELEDISEFHLGIEHILFENYPVRAGFYWTPMYYDKDISKICFTLGGEYYIQNVSLALSAEIGKRKYNTQEIPEEFSDAFSPLEVPQDSEVDETPMRVMMSIGYEL